MNASTKCWTVLAAGLVGVSLSGIPAIAQPLSDAPTPEPAPTAPAEEVAADPPVAPPPEDAGGAADDAAGEPAAAPAAPLTEADLTGPIYPITRFELRYLRKHPQHPPIDEVMQVPVTLGRVGETFVAPVEGVPTVTQSLADYAGDEPRRYHFTAVQRVLEQVRDHFVEREYLGIYVAPDPLQIGPDAADLRPAEERALDIVITTGVVTRLRTLAQGDRIDPAERIDHPLHAELRAESPVQPYEAGDEIRRDLIRKDVLDEYALFRSRHPGRRVDIALSPAPEVGGVSLDYLVTETKPWLVYAQLSNTGTENTSEWREQFGFRHYQLTNNDDILALDYVTANFDEAHAVFGSYEAPLFDLDRLRGRAYAGWTQYTASDVGIFDDTFEGESWHVGGELRWNVYQRGSFFVDLGGGGRFEHIEVQDTLPGSMPGDADLFSPYVFVRTENLADWQTFDAGVTVEWLAPGVTDLSDGELDQLGRSLVADDWTILRWDATQTFYLEPIVHGRAFLDPTTPRTSTLAHELAFGVRGQYTFDERVIPQYEQVAGGLYTVRGYEESIVAGDLAVIGSAEYRYHVPRAFALEPEPRQLFGQPFRFAPQQVYGPTDWDLILKAFLDAGYVRNESDPGSDLLDDDSTTLVGAGVGFEFQYRRNLTLRLDWGFALHDVNDRVDAGSSQVHFALTLLY